MAITVRAMQRADLPICVNIACAAFDGDLLFNLLYPRQKEFPDELYRCWLLLLKVAYAQPSAVGMVAEMDSENEANKVVGFAIWKRAGGSTTAGSKARPDSIANKIERGLLGLEMRYQALLDHRDPAAFKTMRGVRYEALEKLESSGYWYLGDLATLPEFQRKGVARALIAQGKELSAEEGLPIGLKASTVGQKVYARLGFRVVEHKKVLNGQIDGIVMVWEP